MGYKYFSVSSVLAALLLLVCSVATAQQRTLRIEDGRVYIDNREVDEEELPDGLRTDGLTAVYTFSGDVRPVVQIGAEFYVLDDDMLRIADDDDRDRFRLRHPMPGFDPFQVPDVTVEFSDELVGRRAPGPPHAVVLDKADLLYDRARKMGELQRDLQAKQQSMQMALQQEFGNQRMQEFEQLAQEMSMHAVETAKLAQDIPRIELQHYLQDIQRNNETLFKRLVDERALEERTLQLSQRIRVMDAGAERNELVQELRAQLDEIFELKQDNRRHEVEQLEMRLEELEEKISEREELRERIIEKRLKQLLGDDAMQW